MTTSNKNFKIKNGLEVQGTEATVNGEDVLTTGSGIASLSDVSDVTPENGDTLVFNEATGLYTPLAGSSGQPTTVNIGEVKDYADLVDYTQTNLAKDPSFESSTWNGVMRIDEDEEYVDFPSWAGGFTRTSAEKARGTYSVVSPTQPTAYNHGFNISQNAIFDLEDFSDGIIWVSFDVMYDDSVGVNETLYYGIFFEHKDTGFPGLFWDYNSTQSLTPNVWSRVDFGFSLSFIPEDYLLGGIGVRSLVPDVPPDPENPGEFLYDQPYFRVQNPVYIDGIVVQNGLPDGLQVNTVPDYVKYFDGNSENSVWLGAPNNSESVLTNFYRTEAKDFEIVNSGTESDVVLDITIPTKENYAFEPYEGAVYQDIVFSETGGDVVVGGNYVRLYGTVGSYREGDYVRVSYSSSYWFEGKIVFYYDKYNNSDELESIYVSVEKRSSENGTLTAPVPSVSLAGRPGDGYTYQYSNANNFPTIPSPSSLQVGTYITIPGNLGKAFSTFGTNYVRVEYTYGEWVEGYINVAYSNDFGILLQRWSKVDFNESSVPARVYLIDTDLGKDYDYFRGPNDSSIISYPEESTNLYYGNTLYLNGNWEYSVGNSIRIDFLSTGDWIEGVVADKSPATQSSEGFIAFVLTKWQVTNNYSYSEQEGFFRYSDYVLGNVKITDISKADGYSLEISSEYSNVETPSFSQTGPDSFTTATITAKKAGAYKLGDFVRITGESGNTYDGYIFNINNQTIGNSLIDVSIRRTTFKDFFAPDVLQDKVIDISIAGIPSDGYDFGNSLARYEGNPPSPESDPIIDFSTVLPGDLHSFSGSIGLYRKGDYVKISGKPYNVDYMLAYVSDIIFANTVDEKMEVTVDKVVIGEKQSILQSSQISLDSADSFGTGSFSYPYPTQMSTFVAVDANGSGWEITGAINDNYGNFDWQTLTGPATPTSTSSWEITEFTPNYIEYSFGIAAENGIDGAGYDWKVTEPSDSADFNSSTMTLFSDVGFGAYAVGNYVRYYVNPDEDPLAWVEGEIWGISPSALLLSVKSWSPEAEGMEGQIGGTWTIAPYMTLIGRPGADGIDGAGYDYVLPEGFGGPGVAYEPVGNSTISLSSGDFGAYAVGNYVRYYPNPEADPTAWVEGEITSKTGDESLTITVDNWSETAPGISGAAGSDETRPYMTLASKTGSGYSYTWPFGTHPGSGGFWNPPIAGESTYEVPGPLGAYQVGNYVRFYLNPASYPDAWFEGTITNIQDFSNGTYTTVPGTQYATITIEDWDPSAEGLNGFLYNFSASTPEQVEANELLIANPPYMTVSAKDGVDGAGYNYEPITGFPYSIDLSTVTPGTPGLPTSMSLGAGKVGAYKLGDYVKWTSNNDNETYLYGKIVSINPPPSEGVGVEVTQVNLGTNTVVTSARLSIAGLPGADGPEGAGYNYELPPNSSYTSDLSDFYIGGAASLGVGVVGAYKVGDYVKWASNDDPDTWIAGEIFSTSTFPSITITVEEISLGTNTNVASPGNGGTGARLSIAGRPGADGALNAVAKVNGTVTTASTSSGVVRNIYTSTSNPSGGMDGDVWMVYS